MPGWRRLSRQHRARNLHLSSISGMRFLILSFTHGPKLYVPFQA
jgi:hypothetical protein